MAQFFHSWGITVPIWMTSWRQIKHTTTYSNSKRRKPRRETTTLSRLSTHPHYSNVLRLQQWLWGCMPFIHAFLSNLFRIEQLTNLYKTDGCFQEAIFNFAETCGILSLIAKLLTIMTFTVYPPPSPWRWVLCLLTKIKKPYHFHICFII